MSVLLIKIGSIIDGTGSPAGEADIAIHKGETALIDLGPFIDQGAHVGRLAGQIHR